MTLCNTTSRCARLDELSPWTRRPLAAWLSPHEIDELQQWRDTARRRQWLAGRALAKELVLSFAEHAELQPCAIEVLSRDGEGRRTPPRVVLRGSALPWSVSIAHSDEVVAAAVCVQRGLTMGIDAVPRDSRSLSVLGRWFTPAERRWIGHERANAALLWAAKEAVYKAVNQGEPLAPEQIEITRTTGGRLTCEYRGAPLGARCRLETWDYAGNVVALAMIDQQGERSRGPGRICREVAHVS